MLQKNIDIKKVDDKLLKKAIKMQLWRERKSKAALKFYDTIKKPYYQ
jgi:hypothetical protein